MNLFNIGSLLFKVDILLKKVEKFFRKSLLTNRYIFSVMQYKVINQVDIYVEQTLAN